MHTNKKVILVFDKKDYKEYQEHYLNIAKQKYIETKIFYTEYEDSFIRMIRVIPLIGKALHHIFYWLKSFLYSLKIFLLSKHVTVICINPIVAIFIGIMNRNRCKLIMCGFLFESKSNKCYYNIRKKIAKIALKGIEIAVVYARQEVEYYNRIFDNVGKFRFVKYGIDYFQDNVYLRKLPEKYLFSGGGSNRDYKTLFNAYRKIKDRIKLPLCVATLSYCVKGLNTSGINIMTDVILENFGNIMEKSEIVILSLKDTDISAGHQVLLQALSKGIPIIVNDIRAIRDYVSEDNVIFYKSEDEFDLAQKIINVYENISDIKEKYLYNIKCYKEEYMFESMLKRLIKLV